MKKRKFFSPYFIISITLFICQNNSTAQDYYPLQEGNRWDYIRIVIDLVTLTADTTYLSIQVVGDSVFSNGKTYFALNNFDLSNGKFPRGDNRFIYYHDYENEDTLYRLTANIGDSWNVQFPPFAYVTLEAIDTVNIFSQQTKILGFKLDGLQVSYITLSDKFGPVQVDNSNYITSTIDYSFIVGCVLDSIQYGTLLSVSDEPNISSNYILLPNYPNPFNPSTKISYSIPSTSKVTLKIYDILGKEVAILVNEEKSLGEYEVEFNAADLPSGIYFYQLKAGKFIQTKKMVLLR